MKLNKENIKYKKNIKEKENKFSKASIKQQVGLKLKKKTQRLDSFFAFSLKANKNSTYFSVISSSSTRISKPMC